MDKKNSSEHIKFVYTFFLMLAFFLGGNQVLAQCPGPVGDCDGDGIPDAVDLDDNNNGILDSTECPITYIDFSSIAAGISPGDASSVFTNFLNGNSLMTSITIDAPGQLVGSDGLVSISSRNGGSLLRFEDASPAEAGHSFESSIGFASPVKIRFGANATIGLSNITQADQFQFTAAGVLPAGFEWIVVSSNFANIAVNGATLTVSGTSGSGSDFAEFDVYTNLPVEKIDVVYLNLTSESLNSGQFVFSMCQDSDNDGIIDGEDYDSDNDGCSDANEAYGSPLSDGGDTGIYGEDTPTFSGGQVDANGLVISAGVTGNSYTSLPQTSSVSTSLNNHHTATSVAVDATALTSKTIFIGTGTTFTITAAVATSTSNFNLDSTPDYSTGFDASSGFSYQWQEDGIDLANGGVYSGATSRILSLTDVTGLDGKVYTLLILHADNVCFSRQNSATLTVIGPCDPQPSDPTQNTYWQAADCDGDGVTNGQETTDGSDFQDLCSFLVLSQTLTPSAAWDTADCDSDNISNAAELFIDTDGNGIFNALDADDDGDGILTSVEGIIDTDSDGTPDYLDVDSDNDGLNDDDELTIGTNHLVFEDNDLDGISDHFDPDDDNDGILDSIECGYPNGGIINGSFESNSVSSYIQIDDILVPGWSTTDGNSKIELWKTGFLSRSSYDGNILAELNATSNGALYQDLATVPNTYIIWSVAHQGRSSNFETLQVRVGASLAYSVILHTEDATNGVWKFYSGIYLIPSGQTSTTFFFNTPDSGSSGNLVDAISFDRPANSCLLDTDSDGVNNSYDLDSDDDGILDGTEGGTADTDGDGIPNFLDIDDDGDGISTITETASDTDGDGIPNYLDLDSDSDTISDTIEGLTDTDLDGIPNYLDLDSDDDGLLDSVELNVNDIDGDTLADYIDPLAAGFDVSPTYVLVNESGTVTKSVLVQLNRKPISDVVLSITIEDATEVSVSSTTITFTNLNWNVPQLLVVSGVDDAVRDADTNSDLTFAIVDTQSDDDFDPLANQIVQVRNQDDDPEVCFSRDFDDSDFAFIEDATHTSGSDTFSLTPDSGNKRGMVWFQRKLDLRVSFSLSVDVFLGYNDNGADGIAFVIQNISTSEGSSGGGLGYRGISPSYAIEMDTYNNGSPRDGNTGSDHIAFVKDGNASNAPAPGDLTDVFNLENGFWHNIVINWNPNTTRLDYTFIRNGGGTYSDFKIIDLIGDVFNSNIGYWGFTAATGGAKNLQQVRFDDDSICVTDEILPPTATNAVANSTIQVICANSSPTLNDLAKTIARPDGVDALTDFLNNSYNLVWFSSATGTSTYLPGITPLIDATTYYVEAASLSDPNATSYRQSESRLEVIVDLVNGTFTSSNTYPSLLEASGVSTFSLVLDQQPSQNVIYNLSSTDTAQMTVSPTTMTFTPVNWNITQVGTITAVNNLIVDGDKNETLRIQLDYAMSDDCYSITAQNYGISILDDEIAGFLLSPAGGALTEGSTQTASVDIVLTAAPLTDIIIDLQSADLTELTLATASVTFTPSNWNVAQTVLLNAVDELLVDGTQIVSITATVNFDSDPAFTALASQTITVDVQDNDIPGFSLSSLGGTLTEGSTQTASLTLVLDARPTTDVTISVTISPTDEVTISTNSVTFTNANWNLPQTLTLSSVDDFLIDGTINSDLIFSVSSGSDTFFTSLTAQTLSIPNLDNEIAGFTLSSLNGGDLVEGSSASVSFAVVLDAQPDNSDFVILDIASMDTTEASVITTTTSLVFTSANWNIPQMAVLESVDDIILDGTTTSPITVSLSSFSPINGFSVLEPQSITVNTLDNDIAGFTLTPVAENLTEVISPTTTFTAVLNVEPLTNVTLDFSSNDLGEVIVGGSALVVFGPTNWNVPQVVNLVSVDDYIIDGTQLVYISASINASSNDGFLGLASQTVSVTNADNNQAGINVIPLDNLTSESEETASFSLELNSIPTADVSVEIRSTDVSEVTVGVSTIIFTSSNWNVPQIVILTGVDDAPPISDGSQVVTIVTENVNSLDANYGGLTDNEVENVLITNQDNDAPGIVISLLNNNFRTSESGSTITVQFELLAQPANGGSVTIPLVFAGENDEISMTATSVIITSQNWNQPTLNQVVLTGLDDNIIDGTQPALLVTGDPSSSDPPYDNLTASSVADITVYNLDNDIPGLLISQPQAVSENISTTSFTIALMTAVTSETMVRIVIEDPTELFTTTDQLIFSPSNWNIPQTITLFGVDDTLLDGDIFSTISISVDSISCDLLYCYLPPTLMQVLNIDNDFDRDGDMIFDVFDNCIDIPNPLQEDFDADGIGDACDEDRDGDGVVNTQEETDATDADDPCDYIFQYITVQRFDIGDCDNDLIPNAIDEDDDNDGILDIDETFSDFDLDGRSNSLDLDSDGDGCSDVEEAGYYDDDNDGILGQSPVVVDAQGRVLNQGGYATPNDLDNNGIPEYLSANGSIIWTSQPPVSVFFSSSIVVSATASSADYVDYQWQENMGTVALPQWQNFTDNFVVSGSQTNQLLLSDPDPSYGRKQLRLAAQNLLYSCQTILYSTSATIGSAEVIVPNAFSPDADGVNDVWEIEGLNGRGAYVLSVFNRWEIKVFETTDYSNDWEGTSNVSSFIGTDNSLPEGTYFYLLEWQDGRPPLSGFIYIKRRTN